MNPNQQSRPVSPPLTFLRGRPGTGVGVLVGWWMAWLLLLPSRAEASMFKGEALDQVADVLSWAVLVIAPVVGITVFWLVHILPEKIAEKRRHPQAQAIQTLCLLSLVFGGLLWPVAWLWAYSKPVLHKLAYGTDEVEPGHDEVKRPSPEGSEAEKLQQLRQQVAELEGRLAGQTRSDGGKS